MTQEEIKWCKKIKKVINEMPESIELVIGCGHADVYNAGCMNETLDSDGDMDNPDQYATKHFSFFYSGGVFGNESQT